MTTTAAIHPAWRRALADLPIAVVDLETTGLDPAGDEIVEIAVLTKTTSLTTLVRPRSRNVREGCHGLTAAHLEDAPTFGEIAPAVRAALSGRIVVGHCVAFDLAFLSVAFAGAGRPLERLPYICTADLADHLQLDHERRRLTYACARYGVALDAHHVAEHDARAARALFRLYAEIADRRRIDLAALAATSVPTPQILSWSLPPLEPALARSTRLVARDDLALVAA